MEKKSLLLTLIIMMVAMAGFASSQMDTRYIGGTGAMPYISSVNQYYSATFDEEGEAVVSALLTINNIDTTPITELNVEIPSTHVQVLAVLQETYGAGSGNCLTWDYQCTEYGSGNTCVRYDYNGNCAQYERPCLKSQNVCTSYDYNNYYDKTYEKIKVTPTELSGSVMLPIKLLRHVNQNEQSNVMVFYKVSGFSKPMVGAHDFSFETMKVPLDTTSVRVAINVQDGLLLKGTASNVNYRSNFDILSNTMASADKMSGSAYQEMQRYGNSIMYESGLVKTASYLDPHESFTVKGSYSKSWIRLYFDTILIVLAVSGIVIGLLVYGAKKLKALSPKEEPKNKKESHKFLVPFLAGLYTSIGITLLWALSLLAVKFLSESYYYGLGQVIAMLLLILVVLLTLALMIGIPIYVGMKHGALTALFTVLSMMGWLILFTILIFVVLAILFPPRIMY